VVPKEARRAQGGIGADAAALEYDVVDPPSGNVKMLGQLACGYAERLEEFFTQDFAGLNSRAWRVPSVTSFFTNPD